MMHELVVLVTVPSRQHAEQIADILVGERLAACINIVGPIHSVYRWEGAICRDDEQLLIIKTTEARYAELETRVCAVHPYEVPEIIAVPLAAGLAAYREWIQAQTRRE